MIISLHVYDSLSLSKTRDQLRLLKEAFLNSRVLKTFYIIRCSKKSCLKSRLQRFFHNYVHQMLIDKETRSLTHSSENAMRVFVKDNITLQTLRYTIPCKILMFTLLWLRFPQEIWANVYKTRESIWQFLFAGNLGLSPTIIAQFTFEMRVAAQYRQ